MRGVSETEDEMKREIMQPLKRKKPDPRIVKLRGIAAGLEAGKQSLLAVIRFIRDHSNDPAIVREAKAALETCPYLRGGK